MIYPKSLAGLEKAIPVAAKTFGVSEIEAIWMLACVLMQTALRQRTAELRGDPVITCDLCADDQWWRDNYGAIWEWAQWWHCGPFGLDCQRE